MVPRHLPAHPLNADNTTVVNGQHIPFFEAILNKKRVTSNGRLHPLRRRHQQPGPGRRGNGTSGESLVDLAGNTFGNSTLLSQAPNHWEHATAGRQQTEEGGVTSRSATP
ncbi:hypothetical protein PG991_009250 [Apiospora marii]|uniref:Uncharacterized protein n=1 Tax=Apiospora marii TaxID=335849 RepID=A0ABR1RL66_9PEZI